MERKKIGISLGGGAVRGWAHLGVLSELLKAGLTFDFVAGSSVGSLIGAIYCTGMDFDRILEEASRISWWHIARPVWPSQGFVSFKPLERWLVDKLGDITFSELAIPFSAIATDLTTGKSIPLSRGRLAPAVCASCAIPGLVVPVAVDGHLLCDGCVSDTFPVGVLRAMGADYVIAVDILMPSLRPRWGAIGMGLNALEILVQNAGGGIDEADCLIAPNVAGDTYVRFSRRQYLFLQGQQAAREKIPTILDRVK
jgi:NTE family protein